MKTYKLKYLLSIFLAAVLAAGSLFMYTYANPADDLYDGKVLLDLTFDEGTDRFYTYTNGGDFELLNQDQQLACHIKKTGTLDYANQAYLDGFSLVQGCRYLLSLDARSDAACSMQYRIQLNGGDYHAYAIDQAVLGPEPAHFEIDFVMEEPTDPAPRLAFNMGMQADMTEDPGEHTIYIDNIHLEVLDAGGAASVQESTDQVVLSVNHVGYLPGDQKYVITDGSLSGTAFSVVDSEGTECFTGVFSEAMDDQATQSSVCRGDFSALTQAGTYVVQADESLASQPFVIDEHVYDDLCSAVFRMLFLQRCGMELTEETAGPYAHPACHTQTAVIYGTQETRDVSGGWHDAGDYGRYVVPGAQTVADLLFIYEQISPEQAFLEEARYELEWMLKMQDEQTGGVYHKVTCANFPGTVMPQEETDPLMIAPVSDAATADFAAVMAKAAVDYRASDSAFAEICADAAEAAWNYLRSRDELTGFTNPPDISTGEYPDGELKDELFWAAAELLNLVNQGILGEEYREELITEIKEGLESGINCGLGWDNMGGFALFDLAVTETEEEDLNELSLQAKERIVTEADEIRKLIAQDGYFASMGTDYYWGSNMGIANHGMLLLMAGELTGDTSYYTDAKLQLDYLLGVNGLDFCYVSGFGDKCLSDPHHRPSQAVGEAVPGMLAGGPNPNLEDPYAQQVLAGKAPALCYADNQQSYSTNEVAIYWNSPLLVLICGVKESILQSRENAFTYIHDPRENPEAMADIIENPDAVYGFSPDPDSVRLGDYAQYDWTDPEIVQNAQDQRREYHESMKSMTDILYEMRDEGASIEDMARAVSTERNRLRLESYDDDPEGLANVKDSNLKTYGQEDGPTPDQLYEKYGSWETVIQKSFSPNLGMDVCCGLYDEYYWLYIELGLVES